MKKDDHISNTLTRPILPEGVSPRPPISPAHISDKMSPYRLGITMTRSEKGLGLVTIWKLIDKQGAEQGGGISLPGGKHDQEDLRHI